MTARTIKLETEEDFNKAIDAAVEVLESGGLVVYPTDTSYGLACDPRNEDAVGKLFDAKKRDRDIAVPLLFADSKQCEGYHDFLDLERVLTRLFWPGVLTLIVTAKDSVPSYVTGGRTTVAIRVPNHPIPRGIAKKLGAPIVGTSANIAGGSSPYVISSAKEQLGDSVELYIDGGPSNEDNDSTIIGIKEVEDGFSSIKVFREGALSTDMLTSGLQDDTDALRFWTNRIFHAEM
ncbi:MAG: L-threonylcarbamoyladenylate synthase [Candidatus Thorarchaeota archaeon]